MATEVIRTRVDGNLKREAAEILDNLPPEPAPKPKTVKPPRLQPIPPAMFSR